MAIKRNLNGVCWRRHSKQISKWNQIRPTNRMCVLFAELLIPILKKREINEYGKKQRVTNSWRSFFNLFHIRMGWKWFRNSKHRTEMQLFHTHSQRTNQQKKTQIIWYFSLSVPFKRTKQQREKKIRRSHSQSMTFLNSISESQSVSVNATTTNNNIHQDMWMFMRDRKR